MYLDENLGRLNERYNPAGIEFRKEGDIIRLIENFVLNKDQQLKENFKNNLYSNDE